MGNIVKSRAEKYLDKLLEKEYTSRKNRLYSLKRRKV